MSSSSNDEEGVTSSATVGDEEPPAPTDAEVAADDGKTQEWIIEFAGPVRLQKAGWSNETFQPGEMITAVGNPSKAEGTYGMFSPRITREDGSVIDGIGNLSETGLPR